MNLTLDETKKLLKEDRFFSQFGFSMLLERLVNQTFVYITVSLRH